MADQNAVLTIHREHPDWAAPDIAKRLGCDAAYVRATAHRKGLTLGNSKTRNRNPDSLVALGRAARDAGWLTVEAIADAAAKLTERSR